MEIKAIVVADWCPHCEAIKEELKRRGLLDKVKIIDATTEEGAKFADENNIMGIPACVAIDQDGKSVRICSKEEFEKLLEEGK